MSLPDDFNDRLRDGDEDLAGWVFQAYSRRLAALAARNIGGQLQRRIDPEDAAQSAFATFFRRAREGEFAIDDSTDLWSLLARIVVTKVRRQARRHTAKKRAVAAEMANDEDGLQALASREPGPEEMALVQDLIQSALAGLPEIVGEMLALSLQGCTLREVGEKLGVSHMSVKRNLERIREKLHGEEPVS